MNVLRPDLGALQMLYIIVIIILYNLVIEKI